METFSPLHPAIDLSTPLYYQLVYTLTALLPPPLDDSPEALCTRNHAAIAKVAALLPVNANEADLAAQCIAARAQAEEMLRLLRQHAGDIGLVLRLNAQYGSMVRTSLSVLGRLMRVQAVRQKREAIDGAASEDAWTLHVAERSMLGVVDPDAGPVEAAWPGAAPAADVDQRIEDNVSEDEANSQDAAFETWLSAQPWNRGSRGSGETDLREVMRAAMAERGWPIRRPKVLWLRRFLIERRPQNVARFVLHRPTVNRRLNPQTGFQGAVQVADSDARLGSLLPCAAHVSMLSTWE
jgi:hypothetical protein